MTLYLKTTFQEKMSRLSAKKIEFSKKNNSINVEDFPKFKDIQNTGVLNVKIHPFEAKRWWETLSKEAKDSDFVLCWDGGWISIPGSEVEEIMVDY